MFAVIKTGGKQYRVAQGDVLAIERLPADKGAEVTFDQVLMIGSDDDTTVGTPTVAGATVTGTIVSQERGKKVTVFKFRRRKNYKRTAGHRQYITRVKIDAIAVS